MKEKVMQGKPYAGNPHVRFDEGAVVPARLGRFTLLYKGLGLSVLSSLVSCAVWAAESTLLDGKVVITSDDDTGSITSLVATPSGGETLTIPSSARAPCASAPRRRG